MPYKDPEHKRLWELKHRARRLAKRRELRRAAAAQNTAQTAVPSGDGGAAGFLWLPVAGGVALASYNPKLAISAGSVTLFAAAALKKNWIWWISGVIILIIGLFFHWSGQTKNETK